METTQLQSPSPTLWPQQRLLRGLEFWALKGRVTDTFLEVERHKIAVLKFCSSYGTGLISGLISLLFLPFPPAMASHPTQTQGTKEFSLWSPLESPSRRGFAFCHLQAPISPPALSGKRKGIGKNEARTWFLIYNWLQYVPSILILFKSYHLEARLGYDLNPKSEPSYTNDII